MKFLPLIWFGLWRRPTRTFLTFLQIVVAYALFGALQGMKTGIDEAIANLRADILIAHSRASFGDPMPLAGLERVKSVPGVKIVKPQDSFYATFQTPKQGVFVIALDVDQEWLRANPELEVAPRYLSAFLKTRTGALVNEPLAHKYNWRVGDRIPLNSNMPQKNGSTNWAFDIVGTFRGKEIDLSDYILIHFNYLDEARAFGKSSARLFFVVVSDPKEAPTVADEIDKRFANSSHEVRTESSRERAQSLMQSIGDLDFAIRAIVTAVLVALLFSISTTMMQSIRERLPELAVLKTIGFRDSALFLLTLGEGLIICTLGAAMGLTLATLAFPLTTSMVPGLSMPFVVIEIGLASAILIALTSATVPALRAARLNVTSALAGR